MFPDHRNHSAEGFVFLATCLRPQSRGWVHLNSKNPTEPPTIQPNYLQDPYDVVCTRQGKTSVTLYCKPRETKKKQSGYTGTGGTAFKLFVTPAEVSTAFFFDECKLYLLKYVGSRRKRIILLCSSGRYLHIFIVVLVTWVWFFSGKILIKTLILAVRLARRLVLTTPFQRLGAKMHLPVLDECREFEPSIADDQYVDCLIRTIGITSYHPAGTAAAGNLSHSVLDSAFRLVTKLLWPRSGFRMNYTHLKYLV